MLECQFAKRRALRAVIKHSHQLQVWRVRLEHAAGLYRKDAVEAKRFFLAAGRKSGGRERRRLRRPPRLNY